MKKPSAEKTGKRKEQQQEFFTDIYGSWEALQREKFEKIFDRLGEKFTAQLKTKRIIDIGAGAGYLEEFLAGKGIKNIIAVEPDRTMLRTKKNFTLAKAGNMPFKEDSFDAAFVFDAMHLIDKTDISCLKKNGIAAVSTFYNDKNYEEKRQALLKKMKGFAVLQEFSINSKEKEIVIVGRKK